MDGGRRPLRAREMDVPLPSPTPPPSSGLRPEVGAGLSSPQDLALPLAAAVFCPPKKPCLATPGHGIVCR